MADPAVIRIERRPPFTCLKHVTSESWTNIILFSLVASLKKVAQHRNESAPFRLYNIFSLKFYIVFINFFVI